MQSGEDNPTKSATADEFPAVAKCSLCQVSIRLQEDISPQQVECPACGLEQVWTAPEPPEPDEGVGDEAPVEPPIGEFDRWLAGDPIVAPQVKGLRRLRRWQRRHRVLVALCFAAAGVLMMAILVPTVAYVRSSRDLAITRQHEVKRRQADRQARADLLDELRLAQQQRREAEERSASRGREADLRCAEISRQYRMVIAQRLADQSLELAAQKPTRSIQLAVESIGIAMREGQTPIPSAHQNLRDLMGSFAVQTLSGHTDKITSLAFSHDGRWLASGSFDETVRLWNPLAGDIAASSVELRGHRNRVSCVRFTPDGRYLASCSFDSTARLWNLSAPDPAVSPIVLRGGMGRLGAMAISRDGHWLATGGGSFRVEESHAFLWNLEGASPATRPIMLDGHSGGIRAIALSPDGRWIATAGEDRTARLWNLTAGNAPVTALVLHGHSGSVSAAEFTSDGRRLVTVDYGVGEDDYTARIWNVDSASVTQPTILAGHKRGIRGLALSPNGRWLVTASDDHTARVWDLSAEDPVANSVVLRGHEGAVQLVSISGDGRWVVTGSADGTARLWGLGDELPDSTSVVLRGHKGRLTAMAICPNSHWLATAGEDNNIRIVPLRLDSLINLAREHTRLATATGKKSPASSTK